MVAAGGDANREWVKWLRRYAFDNASQFYNPIDILRSMKSGGANPVIIGKAFQFINGSTRFAWNLAWWLGGDVEGSTSQYGEGLMDIKGLRDVVRSTPYLAPAGAIFQNSNKGFAEEWFGWNKYLFR